ncbi:MAG TPA: hypothetical protein VN976_22100 [Verrucomicrobiae bacterium]|nr:hypothetical protein [Verrucomicrobiae bacterium]
MKNKPTVYVEVSGGVAEVTRPVPGVAVFFIDWDSIKVQSPKQNRNDYPPVVQKFLKAKYPDSYQQYFVDPSAS